MKRRKRSIVLAAGVLAMLVLAGAFAAFFMTGIMEKMNRSANETLLNSTRMIRSSLENEITADEQTLNSLANLIAMGPPENAAETLAQYAQATDFFRFAYVGLDGTGIDSQGQEVRKADFPFAETALTQGQSSYSEAYHGDSGRLQITFQAPVLRDGEPAGALYADRALNGYNRPELFTFSGGNGCAYVVDGQTGGWVIESTGINNSADLFAFLDKQGNGEAVCQTLREVMAAGKSGTVEVRFKGQSSFLCFLPLEGPHSWYIISILPRSILQQEADSVMGMISGTLLVLLVAVGLIVTLVLNRKNMKNREKERAYREQLFQTISANVDFAFLLYSPAKRRVELVSDNVASFFGIEADAVMQRPELLFNCCGVPAADAGRLAFFQGSLKEKARGEYQIGTEPHELQRWIDVHLSPASGGQYLAVFHDATQEHHLRETLAEALRRSQESSRAKTAFFSSMSHDIRTPMNGITGMTSIAMANLDDPEKVQDCLKKIMAASDHLLSLINEVLDMSRIESGRLSLKEEAVQLPAMIASLISFVKPDILKKHQLLRVESTVLDYDTVLSDSLHLQKVLLNLLSNAVKYTPENGEISVWFQQAPRADGRLDLQFAVQDNGVGMSAEFLQKIFTPFERAEDNRTSKVTGTGLGMAITKSIVDLMGGTIAVESKLGVGSTFRVTVPVRLPESQEQRPSALAGRSVLIVDDDETVCESVQLMLQEAQLRADWVLSGGEALKAVAKAHQAAADYFAVVLDWKMPEMDGIEAARRIRGMVGDEVPILLLSAYNWEDAAPQAKAAGVNGFLTKPIFKSELLQKLRDFLPEAAPPEPAERAPAKDDLQNIRVLVAEDNELNREIAEELLRSSGATVESVENGRLAVRRYQERPAGYYDVILMDLHMPEMNGYEATREIRRQPREDAAQIPIIAMTADAFAEDVQRCMEAGMTAHIAKPIVPETLIALIRRYYKQEGGAAT